MSLRDWFAGQALIGITGNSAYVELQESWQDCAKAAYAVADAMLKAREVQP